MIINLTHCKVIFQTQQYIQLVEEHLEVCKFASGLSKLFGEILCQNYLGCTSPPVFGERNREFWDILRENEVFVQDPFKHVAAVDKLYLNDAQLSKSDIQRLTKAIRAGGKLPHLKYLNISFNDLSHMEREVEALIAACDAHSEEPLELWLWGTGLTEEFIQRCRDTYLNVEIPSAETLNFGDVKLSKADIQSISRSIMARKLPKLKKLNLSNKNPTGCLKLLFGGPDHPGFPSLEELNLALTHLNQKDVKSLNEAIKARKLPRLWKLNLSLNDLRHMEREVEALIAACDTHCEKRLKLWLRDTVLSQEFIQRCRGKYRNVEIDWF